MKIVQAIRTAQELSGKWTIPILLSLQETGGRFTPLQHHLDISPSRLTDNLQKLEAGGIVRHLSPYERRHPLLPEYRLTEKGLFLREAAQAVRAAETELDRGRLSEKLWNWPVLLALHQEGGRFRTLREMLESATPRILSMRIEDLSGIGLIRKRLAAEPRPGFRYELEPGAIVPVGHAKADLLSLL